MDERAKAYSAIIEHLTHVQQRPHMYCGELTENAIWAYLAGFNAACGIMGLGKLWTSPEGDYWAVCAERGWDENALGPQKHMRDAGWDDNAIINELLTIETETWRRISGGASLSDGERD